MRWKHTEVAVPFAVLTDPAKIAAWKRELNAGYARLNEEIKKCLYPQRGDRTRAVKRLADLAS